ncbi:MAG TPA: hypothetical protein VN809_15530 [Telmatospirillum sp.]|nr:hypothetical protein [Telmatospirillum sp.]
MMRAATILWAILAAAAGTSLFMLKYEVQAQEQRLSSLRKDIVEAKESIHVLKAEWSYLNDPSRLREQAERHLGLHPLKPSQIVAIASLPMNDARPSDAPLAQGPVAPLPAAPTVTAPLPPQVMRKAPSAPVKVAPVPAQPPSRATTKPARSMTAAKTLPAPAVTVATAKPAPKQPVKAPAIATAKPAPATQAYSAPYPTYGNASEKPSGASTANSAGNVMVIKSPALADPEVASTRVRP